MNNKPLVSIIVPVYNKEQYIKECVDSLVKQTYVSTEIILVDDESTDSSGKICEEYAAQYANVKVIHKKNGGLVSTWKTGVREATGDFLSFVDSDDYIDVEMIAEMISQIDDSMGNKLIVSSDYIIERDDGDNTICYQRLAPGRYDKEKIATEVIPNLLGHEHRLIHYSRCMKLIGKELIVNNMDYADIKLSMGEDVSIMLPSLLDMEYLIVMDHRAFYHYRFVDSSMVHYYDSKSFDNNKLLYSNLKSALNDKLSSKPNLVKSMNAALDREEIFLLLLSVKNAARGSFDQCLHNIKTIREDVVTKPVIENTVVKIDDKANKLLYFTLKHPNVLVVALLKLVFRIYYRK